MTNPFNTADIHIQHDADWRDSIPQLLDADGEPRDCTGYDLELLIRPTYDHTVLLKKLTTKGAETLGPERVVNGSFASATGWTVQTNWTVAAGVATHAAGSILNLKQTIDLGLNSEYEVVFTVLSRTAGSIGIQLRGDDQPSDGTIRSTNGTFTERLIAYGQNSGLTAFALVPSSDFVGSVDNVSAKEVRLPELYWVDAATGKAAVRLPRGAEGGVRATLPVTSRGPARQWDYFLTLTGQLTADPADGVFVEEILRGPLTVHPGNFVI